MSSPLPFLKDKKPQTGIVTEHRSESDSQNPGLDAVADELMRAVEAKDRRGVGLALKNAFELLQAMQMDEAMEQG